MKNSKSREEIYLELIPLLDQSFVFNGLWTVEKIDDVIDKVFKEYYRRNLSAWLESEILQNYLAIFYLIFKRPFTISILFDFSKNCKYDSIAVRKIFVGCKIEVIEELNINVSDKTKHELNQLFLLIQQPPNIDTEQFQQNEFNF